MCFWCARQISAKDILVSNSATLTTEKFATVVCRCFEKDEASQQESREYNHVTSTVFEKAGTLVISDYIPYLRFISKWQGHEKAFLDTRKMVLHTMRKMTKLDSRRKCLEEGRILDNTPRDFVDVMLSMPSETGEGGLSDESILFVIMVWCLLLALYMLVTVIEILLTVLKLECMTLPNFSSRST